MKKLFLAFSVLCVNEQIMNVCPTANKKDHINKEKNIGNE